MNILLQLWRYTLLFTVVMVGGSISFMHFENKSFWDSIYYSIVTVSTVGYGDIHPTTPQGKVAAVFIIILGVGTFLGILAEITELIFNRRDLKARKSKINILVGIFFNEIGTKILSTLHNSSKDQAILSEQLNNIKNRNKKEVQQLIKVLSKRKYKLDPNKVNLEAVMSILTANRDLMIRFLENPVLLEHETFTDLIQSIFHLSEELTYRTSHGELTDDDFNHLLIDIERVFHQLVPEWVKYIKELQYSYPHLFAFAIKMNPFKQVDNSVVN